MRNRRRSTPGCVVRGDACGVEDAHLGLREGEEEEEEGLGLVVEREPGAKAT